MVGRRPCLLRTMQRGQNMHAQGCAKCFKLTASQPHQEVAGHGLPGPCARPAVQPSNPGPYDRRPM